MISFYGYAVYLDASLVETRYVFPQEKFFEWEPKDERLCRLLGIGHEETGPSKTMYQIGQNLYMHPTLWEEFGQKYDLSYDARCNDIIEATLSRDGKRRYAMDNLTGCAVHCPPLLISDPGNDFLKDQMNEWRRVLYELPSYYDKYSIVRTTS